MPAAPSAFSLRPPVRSARWAWLASASVVVAATLGSLYAGPAPFLLNRSASEPPGLYARTSARPHTGVIIAFPAPRAAFPYADRRMAYLHRRPLLKAVAAQAGDHVCTQGDVLQVNGVRLGPVAARDREGRVLPKWRGCRRLSGDELFVFSGRVPNSFDSRYYGPIHLRDVLGVYAWVAPFPGDPA